MFIIQLLPKACHNKRSSGRLNALKILPSVPIQILLFEVIQFFHRKSSKLPQIVNAYTYGLTALKKKTQSQFLKPPNRTEKKNLPQAHFCLAYWSIYGIIDQLIGVSKKFE